MYTTGIHIPVNTSFPLESKVIAIWN